MSQRQSAQTASLTGYVAAFAAISVMSLCVISCTKGIYASSFMVIGATAFLLTLSGWLVVRNGQLLAASEERSRGLIDNALVGIFVHKDGKFQFVNKRFAEMLGYEPEELAETSVLETVHPDHRDMVAQRMRTREAGENVADTYQLRFLTKSGESGWADVWARPIAGGADQGILVNVVDITERKRAEEALRESEERFRTLFDGSVDAIFLADPDTGMLVEANEAAEALTGYSRAELLHMHQSQVHPPDEAERYRRMFAQHVEQGSAVGFEAELRRKDGSSVPIYISAALIEIAGRRLLQGRFVDLSERKEAERQLQASEKKFRTFTEQSLHPIWVIQDGRIVYCNSALSMYIGADSPEQAQGMKLNEIVEAESWAEVETRLRLLLSGKSQGERMAIRFTPLPGEVRWHDVQLGRIEYEGRPAVLADSQDITEIKLLMEELDAERLHDSLTGLYNRRYFNDVFGREVKHSDRYGTSLTLLMLDVDNFKAVNDAFGHAVGDQVLQAVAEVVRQHARGADIPIRFGGDEFLIVMPNTSWADAEAITRRLAERLTEYLQEQAEKGQLPDETAALVWISGGAASYQHETDETLDDVVRRADERMYEQKERNRAWRDRRGELPAEQRRTG